MKIRVDVVELLHRGYSNVEIAERTGVSAQTIAKNRHRLGLPNARRRRRRTVTERLYAEALPTGRVDDYRPPSGRIPLSPAQQASNRATLLAALRGEAA
ncbi:MAG: helix-turn-helix domain-containing protein [Kitasatospora sp.]|jgi:hypothetical protein|nr:helix-turn-helix domain-containing protein [Kitasatospora sp.]